MTALIDRLVEALAQRLAGYFEPQFDAVRDAAEEAVEDLDDRLRLFRLELRAETSRLARMGLYGAGTVIFAIGSLLWICASPYRPNHGRKNWFFGGTRFAAPAVGLESEIRFETLRSSGPGGQHVNTTDSAVRATHLASGISVKVQSERSQHANKRLALLLIARRLAERAEQADDRLRAERRLLHHRLERGNPRRTFRGNAPRANA